MEWIESVEHLTVEFNHEKLALLTEFEENSHVEDGRLIRRVQDFLSRNLSSPAAIHFVRDVMLRHLVTSIQECKSVWRAGIEVTVSAQEALHEKQEMLYSKFRFLCCIYREMLASRRWAELQGAVYESVNHVLLQVLAHRDAHPADDRSDINNIVHFEVKELLVNAALAAWYEIMPATRTEPGIAAPNTPQQIKINLELLVPTLRRLGMEDCLDIEWAMVGHWDHILEELEQHAAAPVPRIPADLILEKRSAQWANARNSMRCRSIGHAAPQCFQYFAKCTVMHCSSIETTKKPHPIRCTTCWYFHCCSEACKRFAESFNMHRCSFTAPAQAASTKQKTELYLQVDAIDAFGRVCNFCGSKRELLPAEKMRRCSACKAVWYCNQKCQEWDWQAADHKSSCKKR